MKIPPADEQFEVLARGTADLNPVEDFKKLLDKSHRTQTPLKIKTGFDPTAPDIHIGHMVLIEKMAQFQRFGHDVIFLVGDYTALIGDPTGRNTMRPPLSVDEIKENAATYTDQVFKLLDRDLTRVEWNSTWLDKLTFHDVIKLASRYNVGRMLERRDFKDRFEQNKQIAVHEFLYPLMQGYDSVALEADVELGGHDQIFNLNVGRHLMQAYTMTPQAVLTVKLLVGLDGEEKMSKSKGNHVGITDPPEEMFGKVMSISDETMWSSWYPLLTDRSPDPNTTDPLDAKKSLAQTLVTKFHGESAGDETRAWWDAGRPMKADAEEKEVSAGPLHKVVVAAGLANSGGDAKRKITQGGVSVDDEKIKNPTQPVGPGNYTLKVGRHIEKIKVVG